MTSFAEKPILYFTSADDWERWILEVGDPAGVRLQLRKRLSAEPGITYDEALDVALCHGWIDGQVGRFDEHYTLQPSRRVALAARGRSATATTSSA